MDSSDERPKAYLVLTVLGGESVRIPVYKSPYTIGRAKSCNYSIPNKILSGQHCRVSHDEEKNCFFIEDTSTNGMLVNKKVRTTKGQKVCLKNGDEVFLVYRKQSASLKDVISFQFEEVQEEVSAIDLDSTLLSEDDEATQEYLVDVTKSDEVGPAAADDEHKKRKRESEDDQVSPGEQSKKPHIASVADVPVSVQAVSKDTEQIMDQELGVNPAGMVSDDKLESKSLEMKEEEEEAKGGVPLPPKEKTEGEDAVEEPPDEMMQTLICSICQDILHDCVSVQPCMHTFCAACYSQWMNKSGRCPTCRKRVKRLSKNHIVNNLVDAYLKTHPEKKRSQEDIDEMNASNKITADTVINPRLGEETYSDESGEDLNSSSELDDSTSFPISGAPWWTRINNVIGKPFLPTMTCRQCPGNPPSSVATSVTQAQPSTSAGPPGASSDFRIASGNVRVALPTAPAFVCPPVANHLMCQCCQERFPDRRRESNQSNIPSVTCSICQIFYCHMYWGCSSNRGCFGCLNKFKDLNFGNKCTDRLILGNTEESSIFKNYLQQNNLTWKDVLNECMRQLDCREMSYHTLLVMTNNITKDSILCYSCGMKVFKELAYAYRASISHQMPAEVTSRPNCYWGSNCRTQFTKPLHAVRYNHVCHQTRF